MRSVKGRQNNVTDRRVGGLLGGGIQVTARRQPAEDEGVQRLLPLSTTLSVKRVQMAPITTSRGKEKQKVRRAHLYDGNRRPRKRMAGGRFSDRLPRWLPIFDPPPAVRAAAAHRPADPPTVPPLPQDDDRETRAGSCASARVLFSVRSTRLSTKSTDPHLLPRQPDKAVR